LREEARVIYIAVARTLAKLCVEAGDLDAAIRYRLRVLEHDPYDEGVHLAPVSGLLAAGRQGEGRRAYRRYVARMDELDVEPASLPSAGTVLSSL
jgi:DNA-binding SARP family transcriptional activator